MMLTLALLVFGLLQAPGSTPEQNDVRKTLERLENEWNVAHVRGDAAALDRIFSDDVVVIVPGMRVMTKADAVGMFRSGRMKFDKYDTSETTFRILNDTAIVTGRLKRTRVMNGATTDDDWRFTKVYVHRTDRWQVISFHASNTGS
jgi:ketosteroid isomerase-like protein